LFAPQYPFTLFERDKNFDARSPGYGLTLQQAKAIEGLGVFSLDEGVVSTRHLVHTTEGRKVIGEWGIRKWMQSDAKKSTKRTNVHIARQSCA
jgi:hypothetical protein